MPASASSMMSLSGNLMSAAVGNVIALFAPERVVIGGGVSRMGPLFWDPLHARIRERMFEPFAGTVRVVPSALGERAVATGAVLLGAEGLTCSS